MKILVDGMGGDNAPKEIVKGVIEAAEIIDENIYIIGDQEKIKEELDNNNFVGENIHIVHASEKIVMEDSPVKAIRSKKDSSMVVGLTMLKKGEGDLFISAGNTGALVVGSRLITGRIKGVDRPVLASIYPRMDEEPGLLLDAGASSESKANNLLDYAIMGSIYVEKVWKRKTPRVGLVNIGVEENKGTSVIKEAYQKIAKTPLNFVGNVEAREVPKNACDVIVCDGFVGNVILKLTEGVAISILGLVKQKLLQNTKTKMAALILKKQLKELKEEFDYEEYGGAPILGVKKPVLKIHGSSRKKAVKNAILKGIPYSKENVVSIIEDAMKGHGKNIETVKEVSDEEE